MTNNIKNLTEINKENLSKYHYTLSLLQEARRNNLINDATIANIQQQIFVILKELILKYTAGKSTSVKIEIAKDIQSSILYAVDIKLAKYSNPDDSLSAIKEMTVRKIYKQGVNLIEDIFEKAKKIFQEIKENKLKLTQEVYNSTIEQGIPLFFSNYDIKYNADNTMALIDYPLIFDDMKLKGVLYIINYLKTLKLETNFCKKYNINNINKLLINYGYIYNIDYREIPLNIFEIVINSSIFSAVIDENIYTLNISYSQFQILHELFRKTPQFKIAPLIDTAIQKIIKELSITDDNLIKYIEKYKPLFTSRLLNAIENNCLENLTLTDTKNKEKKVISFTSRDSMNDTIFRALVEKIRDCPETTDKINIIKEKVKSLDDLLDILSADCLYENEFDELYKNISDIELAVIAKIVFFEEIRTQELNLQSLKTNNDYEEEWKIQFIKFINGLDKNKKEEIDELINSLEI